MTSFPKTPRLKVSSPKTAPAKREFSFRRTARPELSWRDVNADELKCAIMVATRAGVMIAFSRAQGGRGVIVKLFIGDDKPAEFAGDADELDELLAQVVDQLCEEGSDPRAEYLAQPYGPLSASEIEAAENVLKEPGDFLGGKPDLWGKVRGEKVTESFSDREKARGARQGQSLTPEKMQAD